MSVNALGMAMALDSRGRVAVLESDGDLYLNGSYQKNYD